MAIPTRNTQWTGIDVVMLDVRTGAPYAGAVSVFVNGDDSGQVPAQNTNGLAVADGQGAYHYTPTIAETNYAKVAFTFSGAFCRPETVTYATVWGTEQQTVSLAKTGTGANWGVRGAAWAGIDVQMVDLSGAPFTNPVSVYVNGDNTGQVLGQTNGGLCYPDQNGVHHYVPTTSETDYAKVSFLFQASGAVSQMVSVATVPAQPMATTTTGALSCQTLIRLALRRINIVQSGQQTVSPGYLTDAFSFLNLMLDGWQAETLTRPYLQVRYANLTSALGTPDTPYQVGPGGHFNQIRPTDIHHFTYLDYNQNPPLERMLTPLTRDAYVAIPLKRLTSPLPGSYYYQPTYESGYGSLYLWMIPTQVNLVGCLYTLAMIPQFATLNDVVILPPAYTLAIVDNLAVMLASTFRENLPPDPMLSQSAATLKANLKRLNVELADLAVDPALTVRRGIYNIASDSVSGRP